MSNDTITFVIRILTICVLFYSVANISTQLTEISHSLQIIAGVAQAVKGK